MKQFGPFVMCAAVLCLCAPIRVHAQATLLLEEPYSYDGTFAGTGHTAIYLSRVCAATPTRLRRCGPNETGVVLSRYHGIAGQDWIAIPLLPYLYAVQRAEDIPLYVNPKLVELLRERYLSTLALPPESEREPRYQLAGSAYDRTLYGFQFATRPEQDDDLIQWLNSSPDSESYQLLKRNCADFVKEIVNFYYPRAVHRSIIADIGVMTPKQAAKSLVHTAKHNPEMKLTTFIIPQVPGLKRSKPVHGVIESVVLAKKYVTPVLLFHPLVVGTVEAAYWAGWRFNPAKGAYIFDPASPNPMQDLEHPLTAEERRAYDGLITFTKKNEFESEDLPNWKRLQAESHPQIDARGRAFLDVTLEGRELPLGLCPENALRLTGSPELVEELMLARLQAELQSKKPRISEQEVKRDWKLLDAARDARQASLSGTR